MLDDLQDANEGYGPAGYACVVMSRYASWRSALRPGFPPRADHSRGGDERDKHTFALTAVGTSPWASAAAAPPHVPTAGRAAFVRHSQLGGAMAVFGYGVSAFTMTISDVTITGCSAEAGGDYGVRSRHVAQRGSSVLG